MSRTKYPPASRPAVLAFLLSLGTEVVTVMGGTKRTEDNPYGERNYDGGKLVRSAKLEQKFGRVAVWKALKALAADGFVKQKLGGRHAGWSLTEAGVTLARAQKAETDTAVRRADP